MSSVERYSYSRSVSSTQQQGVEMTNGGQLRVGDNGRTMVAATGGRHQTRLAQQVKESVHMYMCVCVQNILRCVFNSNRETREPRSWHA